MKIWSMPEKSGIAIIGRKKYSDREQIVSSRIKTIKLFGGEGANENNC